MLKLTIDEIIAELHYLDDQCVILCRECKDKSCRILKRINTLKEEASIKIKEMTDK